MRSLARDTNDNAYIHGSSSAFAARRALQKPQARIAQETNSSFIRLDIKLETLRALIATKVLVVEDLRGLDRSTKKNIKQLLLDNLMVCAPVK